MKIIYTVLTVFICSCFAQAQMLNASWKADLQSELNEFSSCKGNAPNNDCYRYLGKALKTVYKINDFYSEKSGRYMTISEIAQFLKDSQSWSIVGPTGSQETMDKAQRLANDKKAVVAVYLNGSGIGHAVIITPGALEPSASWGLSVPLAASFFIPQPDRSFIAKGMSYAFGKNLMKDVVIYSRNY